MPTSSCPRRPISRRRISTAATAATTCSLHRAAVKPQGQAWSNFRLAQALAARMGIADPVFRMSEKRDPPRILQGLVRRRSRRSIPAALLDGAPVKAAPPAAQEFRTPSGKLEIYSAALAGQGVSPLPDWQPDAEEERDAARWPLRLLTAPSYFQPHTAYSGVGFLRRREGEPFCVLHPRRRGEARAVLRAEGPAVQSAGGRRPGAQDRATRCSRGSSSCPASAPDRKRLAARSTCCVPTASPISAKAPATRAPFSTSRLGSPPTDESAAGADR